MAAERRIEAEDVARESAAIYVCEVRATEGLTENCGEEWELFPPRRTW